jgi:L-galactose dehydrogenase
VVCDCGEYDESCLTCSHCGSGVCTLCQEGFFAELWEAEIDVVLSYCHYSLLNTRLVHELAPAAQDRGVGLVNASPLHMGVLTAGGAPGWHPAPPDVLAAAKAAAAWCADQGADIADVALRFALGSAAVASTLVGMRTEAEVHANVAALEGGPDLDVLAGVRLLLASVQDREWPSGLAEHVLEPLHGGRTSP